MKVEFFEGGKIDRTRWDELVANSPDGSAFVQSWYIDCLTAGKWGLYVLVDEKKDLWRAGIPVFLTKKMHLVFSRQPILSKYWGVISDEIDGRKNRYDRLSELKTNMGILLKEATKDTAVFDYFTRVDTEYPLAFQWENIKLAPRFTYQIEGKDGIEKIRSNYGKSVRKKIRKLQTAGFVLKEVQRTDDLELVLRKNWEDGRDLIPVRVWPNLQKIISVSKSKGAGYLLSSFSPKGELAASAFFLSDSRQIYFISGYVDPVFRPQGVMNLIVDHALEMAAEQGKKFDFFGSQIPNIESFFRSFGAEPKTYYRVLKAKSPFHLIWKL